MYEYDWVEEFASKAAPRLRKLLEKDLSALPPELAALLQRLKEGEHLELALAA